MRCKNCGFDNQEGRYICENCGSPLFDDNNEIIPEEDNAQEITEAPVQNNNDTDDDDKTKDKRNIIIIIVLAVILVAMIVGIIVSAVTNKDEETSSSEPSVSVTEEITEDESTKRATTEKKTTETTTEATTEATTAPPTTVATTQKKYDVTVDIDGSGKVTGDGTFTDGSRTTLVATPDEGYEFIGWYDNKTKELKASNSKYTVTVNSDISLTARFAKTPEESTSNVEG